MPQCRRCPAEIIFAQQNPTTRNPRPSNNPLNARPHADGNLRLDLETHRYDVLAGEELRAARERGEQLYLSHFATCAWRDLFRGNARATEMACAAPRGAVKQPAAAAPLLFDVSAVAPAGGCDD